MEMFLAELFPGSDGRSVITGASDAVLALTGETVFSLVPQRHAP
jgi:hypothetical protein